MAGDLTAAVRAPAPAIGRAPSPFGELLVVATGSGIVRVVILDEEEPATALLELEEELAHIPRAPVDGGPSGPAVSAFAHELAEYFDGRRRTFDSRPDLALVHGFARRVLEAAASIPYGAVATYGELAARAGSPRAARAAGNAMRANPVPFLVPCHRVVPADGSLGGYGGREDRKEFLLDLEARARRR